MNEETIFATALEKKTATERQVFLAEACEGKPDLRSAVEGLLLADADAGSFMEHPPAGVAQNATADGRSQDTVALGEWSGSLRFLEPCDKPGRIGILDQYEIIEVVGHGGMGAVMRAFDPRLSRVVAVKVMSPGLATNPTAVKRFLREATTAASIHHDHVVTIHAVNDSHVPPYLVMQFVEGRTLQQKIDQEGALGLKHILRIGSQAAAGLAAAHKLGVIHRDVKPANILLENGVERVKITDFGLARAADDVQMTQTGIIAGTPQYMSPEQAKGESIDARSDLFALGSVLYTMCTGRPAFRADNPVAVLRRVCDDTPRPIREANAEIPAWLEAIVNKLLAKNPNDRFQTAAEVAELLSQHLAHEQNPAIAPRPPEIECRRPSVAVSHAKSAWLTRRSAIWATAGAILLLIGLSFSEAAGVTNVAATIIRITTGEGTLVIEADDPNVKVAIDGEEVTIHGTGVEEVRLRPGDHKLAATRNGQPIPVDHELVTIARGGKQIVRVAVERPTPKADDSKVATAEPAWQPPEKPDPFTILQEAHTDARAGLYQTALAKHVWYHGHALEYSPSQTGVRLSFALSYWAQLAERYPPALVKLKAARDEALADVKAGNVQEGKKSWTAFQDVVSINRALGEESNTRDLFAFLHAFRPEDAKRIFSLAQPCLIRIKAYQLCNAYLNPEPAFKTAVQSYRTGIRYAKSNNSSHLRSFVEPHFTNQVTTLVALLVVNGRQAEAEKVVANAKKEWDDATFHSKLEDALKGTVPEPWPPTQLLNPRAQREATAAASSATATLSSSAVLSSNTVKSAPTIPAVNPSSTTAASPDQAFVPLFNGNDLTGWQTLAQQPGNWNVKDGILVGEGGISHLFSEKTFGDFHLRAEVRLLKGDSGIGFRSEFALPNYSKRTGLRYPGGYEADIADPQVDHAPGNTGTVRPLKPVMQDLAPMGDWFTFEVIAQDNHFVTKINGQIAADVVDPDRRAMSGRLALGCGHSAAETAVEFRKIEIKDLSSVLPESPKN